MPSPSSFVRPSQALRASRSPSGTNVPPPPAGGVFPKVGAIGSRMKSDGTELRRTYGKFVIRSFGRKQKRQVEQSGDQDRAR